MSDPITQIRSALTKVYNLQAKEVYARIVENEWMGALPDDQKKKFIRVVSKALKDLMANGSHPKGRRQRKTPRDPDEPKRPATAFIMWLNAHRDDLKKQLVEEDIKPICVNVGKKGGAVWQEMDDAEKEVWKEKGKQARIHYEEAMTAYKAKKVSDSVSTTTTASETSDEASPPTSPTPKKKKTKKKKKLPDTITKSVKKKK